MAGVEILVLYALVILGVVTTVVFSVLDVSMELFCLMVY